MKRGQKAGGKKNLGQKLTLRKNTFKGDTFISVKGGHKDKISSSLQSSAKELARGIE